MAAIMMPTRIIMTAFSALVLGMMQTMAEAIYSEWRFFPAYFVAFLPFLSRDVRSTYTGGTCSHFSSQIGVWSDAASTWTCDAKSKYAMR